MIELTDPRLPPELTPGNRADILERSGQRRAKFAGQLQELRSLRSPSPQRLPLEARSSNRPGPISWRWIALAALAGAIAGAATVAAILPILQ